MPRRKLLSLLAVPLAASLVGAACSDDDDSSARDDTTTTEETTTTEATTTEARSTTTTAAPTTTAPATTTTAAPTSAAALRGDGLGLVSFGQAPDASMAMLAPLLGAPEEDSGWQPAIGVYGVCPGAQVRALRWGGLSLLFTEGTTDVGTGQHFFSWRQTGSPPPIATSKGLSVGATRTDIDELHPGAIYSEDELVGGPVVEVPVEGGTLIGFLDGGGMLTNLEGGVPCAE